MDYAKKYGQALALLDSVLANYRASGKLGRLDPTQERLAAQLVEFLEEEKRESRERLAQFDKLQFESYEHN